MITLVWCIACFLLGILTKASVPELEQGLARMIVAFLTGVIAALDEYQEWDSRE